MLVLMLLQIANVWADVNVSDQFTAADADGSNFLNIDEFKVFRTKIGREDNEELA